MRYIVLILCSLQMGLGMMLNEHLVKAEEPPTHVQILLDEKEPKKTYAHQPVLCVYVEKEVFDSDIKVVYFDDEKQELQEIQAQWHREKDSWKLQWRFQQNLENTYIQVSKKDHIYAKSETFTIHAEIKEPLFTIGDTILKDASSYLYEDAITVHVQFFQRMHKELTCMYWKDMNIDIEWNEEGDEAFFQLDQEGRDHLSYTLVDEAGNQRKGKSIYTIVLDRTPPNVQIFVNDREVTKGFEGYYAQHVQLRVEVKDETFHDERSHIFINDERIDCEWRKQKDRYTMEYTLTDGTYKISYDIIDQLQHQQKHAFEAFVVDSEKPQIQIVMKEGIQKEANVHIEIKDAHLDRKNSVLHVLKQGNDIVYIPQWNAWKDCWVYDVLLQEEGEYQVYVEAKDMAGNQRKSDIHSVIIDTTPPQITLRLNQKMMDMKTSFLTNRDVHVAVDIQDAHLREQSIDVYKNGHLLMQKKGKEAFKIVAEEGKNNTYELVIRAIDQAGNQSETRHRFTIQKDMPDIYILNDIFQGKPSAKSWLPKIAHESANYRVIHTVLRKNYQIIPYRWGDVIAAEGFYTLEITAQDAAGNQRTLTPGFSFTIDKTPPVLELIHESLQYACGNKVQLHDTFLLMVEPYDQMQREKSSLTYVYINGQKKTLNNEHNLSITFDKRGKYHIVAGVVDEAGNHKEYVWKIEAVDTSIAYHRVQKPIATNRSSLSKHNGTPAYMVPMLFCSVFLSVVLFNVIHVYRSKN